MEITIEGEKLLLSAEKIIFWQKKRTLLLSDLHFTKDAHFRKHAIAVPSNLTENTLKRLSFVMSLFDPMDVIILGDMFHSDINEGVILVKNWIKRYNNTCFKLVHGNHDVFDNDVYEQLGIELCGMNLTLGRFQLSHEPLKKPSSLNICGHIHPAVRLRGKARQSLYLPCFYFSGLHLVLPSFGEFTGSKAIVAKKADKIYAIADQKVIEVM
ncbi:MAG: ligase-associated DNA damage response endonuclease PdeM [Chitinophagales bacterium]